MGLRFPSRIRLGEDLGPQQLGPPVGGEHERGQASDSGALDAVQERVELQPLLQHEPRSRDPELALVAVLPGVGAGCSVVAVAQRSRLGGGRRQEAEKTIEDKPSKLRSQSVATKLFGPKRIQTKPFFFSLKSNQLI
jgi:hypothetical protein